MSVDVVPTRRANEIEPLDAALKEIFGPPPLVKSESCEEYDAFYDRLRNTVVPKDVIEEILVRDVADLTWEILRLRRLKSAFMEASMHAGIEGILKELGFEFYERQRLVQLWIKGDPSATKKVGDLLGEAQIDGLNVEARTFASRLTSFERMDRLIAQAEARRNNILREVDRHRDAVARRLREAAADIEDADFEDIAQSARKSAP